MTRTVLPVAAVAALIGGGAGAGAVLLLDEDGGGSTRTTIVQQAPINAASSAGADGDGEALTARDLYARDSPGVVFIRATVVQQSTSTSPFDYGTPQLQEGESTGSGFVLDKEGYVLTNAHVVAGAREVTVKFADEKTVKARIVGRDTSTDLALLQVEAEGAELKPLPLGTSRGIQVGDPVIAIGNPFGLERTLTTGVVSALQRRITAPDGQGINNVIQTDAPINPGNSGGPLIDGAGRVIGINSQIETGGSGRGSVGIGFAVPIDTARQIIPQLKSSGRVDRAYLGVTSLTVDRSLEALNLPVSKGALIQSVQAGSPADEAGLQAGDLAAQVDGQAVVIGGDVVTAIDGKEIDSQQQLSTIVSTKKPGTEVELAVVRGKEKRKVDVTLQRRPTTQPTGLPGQTP